MVMVDGEGQDQVRTLSEIKDEGYYHGLSFRRLSDGKVSVCWDGRTDLAGELIVPDYVSTSEGICRVVSIDASLFRWNEQYHNEITVLRVPDTVELIAGMRMVVPRTLRAFEVSPQNPKYCSVDGILYSKDMKNLIRCPPAIDTESVVVPDSVVSVDMYSFSICRTVRQIRLPDSVRFIGQGAFSYCNHVTDLQIPSTLEFAATLSFSNCSPDAVPRWVYERFPNAMPEFKPPRNYEIS